MRLLVLVMMTLAVAGQSPTLCAAALWIAAHEQANLASAEARNDRGPDTTDAVATTEHRTAIGPAHNATNVADQFRFATETSAERSPAHGAWAYHFCLPPPLL